MSLAIETAAESASTLSRPRCDLPGFGRCRENTDVRFYPVGSEQLHRHVPGNRVDRLGDRTRPRAEAVDRACHRRSVVSLFRAVLDRLQLFLQLHHAHILWCDDGALHRLGGQPVQTELGLASLGFAVVGFLAFRGGFDLRLAAVTGPALFTLGAAGVHIHDMIAAGNFAPGNAGTVFYTDILVPIVGFVLLWFQHGYPQATK
jgi:hypothetical protein